MITFSEVLAALEKRDGLFFRGPQSWKPYKVTIYQIKDVKMKAYRCLREPTAEKLKSINPQEVEDVNVSVAFSTGDIEVVSIRFLFTSWKEAAEIRPISLPKCSCGGDPNCKDWRHWYQMTEEAKELMLEANPGYGETDLGGGVVVKRPHIIPGGWGYWEALARQQQAKHTIKKS